MDWTKVLAWGGVFLLGFVCGEAGMLAVIVLVDRIRPAGDPACAELDPPTEAERR